MNYHEQGVYQKGEGPAIVLLHGLFGALSNFDTVVDYFSDRYRVIVPVLPLYSLPKLQISVKGLAKYIDGLLSHLEVEKAHFIGNSLGGHIALLHALKHPEKVNSIVLTGSSGLYEQSFGEGYPKREDYEFVKEKTAFTFYDPKFATKALVDEVYETINNRTKGLCTLLIAKSAIRNNLKDELHRLTMPVQLIWGANDTITPPFVADEFEQLIPNAQKIILEQCGHVPMMEHPDRFNEIVARFLSNIS